MLDEGNRIDAYLKSRLDDYIQETIKLCAQPSVSATGDGIGACVPLVVGSLEKRELNVQVIQTPGNPVIVAETKGNIPVLWAGTGYWDNRAHAPDEHIRLVDFLNGSRHIARIMNGFADCFD